MEITLLIDALEIKRLIWSKRLKTIAPFSVHSFDNQFWIESGTEIKILPKIHAPSLQQSSNPEKSVVFIWSLNLPDDSSDGEEGSWLFNNEDSSFPNCMFKLFVWMFFTGQKVAENTYCAFKGEFNIFFKVGSVKPQCCAEAGCF